MIRGCFRFSWLIYRSAAIFAALFLFAHQILAENVTITSDKGALTIDGRFLGFDGEYLRLETEHGELTLDYRTVTCAGQACPDPEAHVEVIRFAGTGRIGDLILPALVEGFARSHALLGERREVGPGRFVYELARRGEDARIRLSFHVATTEAGLAAMERGEADIAMAARPVRPEDLGEAGRLPSGMAATRQIRLLAYDAVVPIVAPGSQAGPLSLPTLARIFSGEIINWSEIGGADATIALHIGPPDSGLAAYFIEAVLAPSGLALTDDVNVHATDRDVVAAVMQDPNAMGIVSFERVGNAVALALAGGCGLLDVATLNSVKTGDYPLTVPLYLYLPSWRLGPFGRDFMDWLSGAEAQRILRRIGVPGEVASPIPLDEQGDRIVSAIQRAGDELGLGPLLSLADVIEGRERLTPTFRFEPGRSTLDPSSQARVRALARAIAEGRYAGRDLLLAGFSDGQGPAGTNLVLSEVRAEAVKDAIIDALGGVLPEEQTLDIVALGEVMPVSCDETTWGQQANRRVELWTTSDRYR